MKKSNFAIGLLIFVLGSAALGAGGYFLYDYLTNKDETASIPDNKYDENFQNHIEKAIPNNDPTSYRIIESNDLRYTYEDLSTASKLDGMLPSHGNPNVLLVPVEFKDLKSECVFDETALKQLNGAFNGTLENKENSYGESVRSFYRKSSYGALDLNFLITDPFTPNITSYQFVDLEARKDQDAQGTYEIIEEFFDNGRMNGKKINFKDPNLDLNKDGYVDGVWFIYNSKDQTRSGKEKFWPYCYWYTNPQNYQKFNPISAYANCSFAFLFEGTSTGYDFHTITHETGHMMGLDDYYSYDLNGKPAALGGLDMMDLNIGDHNAFSKTALGWTNPIIPLKNSTFTLRPFSETGDCIILANNFNDSAFCEYILLEYYTPTVLNHFDAFHDYPERPRYFTDSGLRAYHIDARLMQFRADFNTGDVYIDGYYPTSNTTLPILGEKNNPYYCEVSTSNTHSRNLYAPGENNSFFTPKKNLIAAIDAKNRTIYNNIRTDNQSLFKVGDKFNATKYKKYFNGVRFNEGSENNFTFKVDSISKDKLEVSITL